ncbi:MAG: ornithine cyclodeaminase family protein [Candidatus Heimdallarchaeota archaeon]|nr:ornithine cyclodeaminase family protein [Candidatus Heimdallarchaeota archaeon]
MDVLIINEEEVKANLQMKDCIRLLEEAHRLLANDQAHQPLRLAMFPPMVNGILATMPAYIGGDNPIMGLKVVTVFPDNHKKGIESHQASILLQEADTGRTKAIIDGTEITAQRTAAASAIATKYLARKEASKLVLVGTGVQAHTHLRAISEVRHIKEVHIWNRTLSKAEKFAETYKDRFSITVHNELADAVRSADIICTLTHAKEPIIKAKWVQPGTHINAVGSSTANTRELETELVVKASIFTDVEESALNEAGDIIIPIQEGKLQEMPIHANLGELINGTHQGRSSDNEITLYKSLGVGIQDIVTANFLANIAQERGFGTTIQM